MANVTASVVADSINTRGTRLITLLLNYPMRIHHVVAGQRRWSVCHQPINDNDIEHGIEQWEASVYPGPLSDSPLFEPEELAVLNGSWNEGMAALCESLKTAAGMLSKKGVPDWQAMLVPYLVPFAQSRAVVTVRTDHLEHFLMWKTRNVDVTLLQGAIQDAYGESTPVETKWNQWHMPFCEVGKGEHNAENFAFIARVAGFIGENLDEELEHGRKLYADKHEACEHVCIAQEPKAYSGGGRSGNLGEGCGWMQLRHYQM